MAVPIAVGLDRQTLQPGAPVPLFRTRLGQGRDCLRVDVDAAICGVLRGRFLMNLSVEGATAAPIIVVLNCDAALKH
jgi:hypothetical protein